MDDKTFLLRILSPAGVFYEGRVDFLEFTSVEGVQGVYGRHAPEAMLLRPCILWIHVGKEIRKAETGNGFVWISGEETELLTEWVKNHPENLAYDTI